MLIKELDLLKAENLQVEDEQMKVIEQIAVTERDVVEASRELSDVRNEVSQVDAANLNLRKDIEHQESMVNHEKEVSHNYYTELTRLRDISFNLDKDIDAQQKRIDILKNEADHNEQRIMSINDMLAQRDDAIMRTHSKIAEAH